MRKPFVIRDTRIDKNFRQMGNDFDVKIDGHTGLQIDPHGFSLFQSDIITKFPEVDVRAFGAKGNGATDDTLAIQTAIDVCSAAGGGRVKLVPGTYLISSPLNMKSKVILEGYYWVNYIYTKNTEIKLDDGANADMIVFGADCNAAGIRRVYLNGNRDNNTGTLYGIKFTTLGSPAVPSNFLDQVNVDFVNGYGIYVGANHGGGYMRDVKVFHCDEDGIRMENVADWRMERVQSGWNEKNGIVLIGSGGSACSSHRFYDPDFHHNGQGGGAEATLNGMYLYGYVVSMQIFGGMVDSNQGNGMYFVGIVADGAPNRNTFIGTNFLSNGLKTANTYSHIRLNSGAGIAGGNHLKFCACNVWNIPTTLPKYIIDDVSNIAPVGNVITGCEIGGASSYGTAPFSNIVYTYWHIDNSTISSDDFPMLPSVYPAMYKNVNYTALPSDSIICVDTSGGNITITLPPLVGIPLGKHYIIQKIASGNSLIINGSSSQTINGAASKTITTQWESAFIWELGSEWKASKLAAL